MAKRNLLAINRDGKGVLVPFPERLPNPPHTTVTRKKGSDKTESIRFYATDRLKTLKGETMPIYLEDKDSFDLEAYADPIVETPPEQEAQTVSAEPLFSPNTATVPNANQNGIPRVYGMGDIIQVHAVYQGQKKILHIFRDDWDRAK